MDRCDVLIVGGGPAGSSCARGLRQAGLDVVIIDKKPFPRDKPCAGWITPEVVDQLQIDLDAYRLGRVLQPISGFQVSRVGGRDLQIDYGRTISYGIRRCEFDEYLLRRCGARLLEGEQVRDMEAAPDGWRVNGSLDARLLVGAGGHFCPVARYVSHGANTAEPVVAAQVIEFEMSEDQAGACRVRPEMPELYFCEDLQGYGWCVRKGAFLNVGLGREDAAQLPGRVREFVSYLADRGRIPSISDSRFRGHAYLLYSNTRRPPVGDRIMLVGDAAGMASAYSGEGIRTAVESGLLAAESIIRAEGDYCTERLQSYTDELVTRFGRPGEGDGVLSHLPAWVKHALAGPFFASRTLVRHIVLDRWFLHASETRSREAPPPVLLRQ